MRAAYIFAPTLALCAALGPAALCQSKDRPNVLFIAVDDLNDWVGCLEGHPQALTPNIDRLAARGILFTNAHCAAPSCRPSRAAVFSGKMPNVTGVWANGSSGLLKLHPKILHLPKAFARAGYRTLGTGKMVHGGSSGRKMFGEYFSVSQRWSPFTKKAVNYKKSELPSKGTDNPRHVATDIQGNQVILPLNRMPSDRKPTEKGGESFDWGPMDVPDASMGDTQITDWAIQKLGEKSDAPRFLGVGYYRPHIPLWAPKKYFQRFVDAPASLPPIALDDLDDLGPAARNWALKAVTAGSHATVLKHKQWRAAVEAYLACTSFVDHQIGRLLDALDKSKLGDNTVIVLWSDHGWHLGEKQHWGKWTGWERSTRVPLIIVPPKNLASRFAPGGSRCDRTVSLIDMYPTLTALCGVDAPKDLGGESLLPLLRNPKLATDRSVATLFNPGNASLRTERWRYIRYADGSEELYDHGAATAETKNIAKANPTVVEKLRARLQKQLALGQR